MLINQKQIPPLEQGYITNLKNRANYLTASLSIHTCMRELKAFHKTLRKLEQRPEGGGGRRKVQKNSVREKMIECSNKEIH